MKTTYFSLLGLGALALLLSGCGKNVKGTYACKGGVFLQGITLESDNKAIVTGNVFGSIQQKIGTYAVDGDNVTITVGGQSTPFIYKDKTLDGGEVGGKCVAQ
jgi:hypothetical protein